MSVKELSAKGSLGSTGKPVVAIVGRPNVGKSALFNRLLGMRQAIVEDVPGTTRDRLYGEMEWGDHNLVLIDTGGLEPDSITDYAPMVRSQVESAISEADAVLFLVDVVDGVTAIDQEIADLLRPSGKLTLLLANKADNEQRQQSVSSFYELALGEPIPISAYHGLGIGELRDRLRELLPSGEVEVSPAALRLAIVGRPNVGKSLLVNTILGRERVIVSDVPGTTRDAIDTPFSYKEQQLSLIDTAGIRRRGRVQVGVEKWSVMRSHSAIERCDVAVVMVDAQDGITAQDLHIAGYVMDAHRGLVLAVNKWDLMEDSDEMRERFASRTLRRLRFASWVPLCFLSAKTGLSVDSLLGLTLEIGEMRSRRVPTAELNAALRHATMEHPPPSKGKRWLRLLYATQAEVEPPTFVIFVSDASLMHFSYQRYLENVIRRRFDFEGTAIRLIFRSRSR